MPTDDAGVIQWSISQKNKGLLNYNGYIYRKSQIYKDKAYYTCIKNNCRSRIICEIINNKISIYRGASAHSCN
jgi:ribosomal protein S19